MTEDKPDIIAQRYEKIAKIRERGINPYSNRFKPANTIGELRQRFDAMPSDQIEKIEDEFSIAGRILRLNFMGKSNFIGLRDRTGEMQAYLNRKDLNEDQQWLLKQLDVGDFLAVRGRIFRTRTNELTIYAKSFELVTKSIQPLPEKWHGLTDVETRYRQRYVDLIANPRTKEIFQIRAATISLIRRFLEDRGFIELDTPILQSVPGGALARPFVTHHNALDIGLYMRIATELHLKRLVVGGFERVYELGRCFRNEGISTWHNPEYSMLEFYMAYADYEDLIKLNEELFPSLAQQIHGKLKIPYQGRELDFTPPFARITMSDAVAGKLGITKEEIRKGEVTKNWLKQKGVKLFESDGWGKALAAVYELTVEHELFNPTFVTQFPIEVSPLSRRNESDPEFADRFEFIIAGKEVANAFSELNDPADQRQRFADQAQAKAKGDQETHPIDEDFVHALEIGMPATAGQGIGIDRLVMFLTDSASIREVIPFPLMRPE